MIRVLATASLKNSNDIKAKYEALREKNILPPIDHFGRMNTASRLAVCAAAVTLSAAGIKFNKSEKQNIGLILANAQGCLKDNEAFFNDYLKGGRRLARANLFIYTLPTSPLAESAIVFNFYGPVIYFANITMKELARSAKLMIQSTDTKKFLLLKVDSEKAQAVLIGEK